MRASLESKIDEINRGLFVIQILLGIQSLISLLIIMVLFI